VSLRLCVDRMSFIPATQDAVRSPQNPEKGKKVFF
jgi:hypothetical protein